MNHIDKKRRPLIPALRFPQFAEQWQTMKLGEVADVKTGSTPRTDIKEYYNGDKLFVSPADIQANKVIDLTKTTLTDLGFSKGRKIPKGSVLFVCIGSTIGKVGIAAQDCLTNQQINALTAKKNYSNNFIYYLLENKGNEIKLLAGIQAVPQINKTDFCNLLFLFPSLPEQQKIADFLSAVDEKLQALKKKKHLLEQYKKGMMQQLFAQTLRFKDEQGNDFPEWEERRLGEVLDYEQPTPYLVSSTEYNNNYTTPVLTAGKTFILGYTDEVFGIFSKDLPIIIFDDFTTASQFVNFPFKAKSSAMKILKVKKGDNIKFLFEAMQMINYEIGGHGRHWISVFAKLHIPLPSLPEQQKIATFLSALDEKINNVQEQVAQVEAWKKGLLQQLFPQ